MPSPSRFKDVPRGPAKWRERDLTKAVKAAKRAGGVDRVEVTPNGCIQLVLAEQALATTNTDPNPWDEVHAANEKRPA